MYISFGHFNNKVSKPNSGFSLIQLSVLLTVAALMMTASLPNIQSKHITMPPVLSG
jgi:competence protein ComGC